MTSRTRFALPFVLFAAALVPLAAQTPTKTTDVLVTLTVKPGIARDRLVKIMPEEVRATVRLYLDGKIRQWFSRADGKGVVFILDCQDVSAAQAIMNALPLAKENLVDYDYTALSPLAPLNYLLGDAQPAPAK